MMSALPSRRRAPRLRPAAARFGHPVLGPARHLPVRRRSRGSRCRRRPSRSRRACSSSLGVGHDPRFAIVRGSRGAPRGARSSGRRLDRRPLRRPRCSPRSKPRRPRSRPCTRWRDLLADPHVRAREVFVEVDGVVMTGLRPRGCRGLRRTSVTRADRSAPTTTRRSPGRPGRDGNRSRGERVEKRPQRSPRDDRSTFSHGSPRFSTAGCGKLRPSTAGSEPR